MEKSKKQTPGCFVILSSSKDCKNLDSERKKNKFQIKTLYRQTPFYRSISGNPKLL